MSTNPASPHFGDRVRVHCGATGRYLGDGLALYVSAQDNDLVIDRVATNPDAPAPHSTLPAPTDRELSAALAALAGLRHAQRHIAEGQP